MAKRVKGGAKPSLGAAVKYLVVIAALGAVVWAWLLSQETEAAIQEEMRIPVRVVRPTRGDVLRTYRVGGWVESASTVTVLPRIAGALLSVPAEVGDRVQAGDIVARLDDEPYRLTLRQAEAAFLAAQSTFTRTEQLFAGNATSRQNYEQAKGQYEAAKSQYELAQLNMAYTEIRAPVAGVIVRRHASSGSLVSSQVPIVTIADLDELLVTAQIAERYYRAFAEDTRSVEVAVTIPALDDETTAAEILRISPSIAPETKSFEVTSTLTDPPELARPGMSVTMEFLLERRSGVLAVPNEAIVGGSTVWYLDGETARKMEIETTFRNDSVTVVPDALSDALILVEGHRFLRDGQAVDVLE